MVILQLLLEPDVINNCHEQRIDAPYCNNNTRVDLSLCCVIHSEEGQILDYKVIRAIGNETDKMTLFEFAVDYNILIAP